MTINKHMHDHKVETRKGILKFFDDLATKLDNENLSDKELLKICIKSHYRQASLFKMHDPFTRREMNKSVEPMLILKHRQVLQKALMHSNQSAKSLSFAFDQMTSLAALSDKPSYDKKRIFPIESVLQSMAVAVKHPANSLPSLQSAKVAYEEMAHLVSADEVSIIKESVENNFNSVLKNELIINLNCIEQAKATPITVASKDIMATGPLAWAEPEKERSK